jgi:bifunctional non-homologous end joining protein LigD
MPPTLVHDAFHRDGWVYEEKADGWRILAYKDGEQVRLLSRNGRDHTRRFRDIAAAISKLRPRREHAHPVRRRCPSRPTDA